MCAGATLPGLARYVESLAGGERPPSESEIIDRATHTRERLLLGLRLDEPVALEDVREALDSEALERLATGGLVEVVRGSGGGGGSVTLTRRGRFLGGGVTAELMTLALA